MFIFSDFFRFWKNPQTCLEFQFFLVKSITHATQDFRKSNGPGPASQFCRWRFLKDRQTQCLSRILSRPLSSWPRSGFSAPDVTRVLPDTTNVKICIRLTSLRSIAGLPDKYMPWNGLYRAPPALVRFGIAATVPASKPPRQNSTARFRLPVTHSLMKMFTGKTGLPSLARGKRYRVVV